jgi:outer membrane receptor protein involved in Fe transport
MPSYEPAAFLQGITVSSEANVVAGRGSVSIQTRNAVEPRFDNYSFFAQDDWKATRRLTLSLGLRYEYNPAPYDANGLEPVIVRGIVGTDVSKATIAPPGTPFYEPFKTAFAPRVGAAYQLNDKAGAKPFSEAASVFSTIWATDKRWVPSITILSLPASL